MNTHAVLRAGGAVERIELPQGIAWRRPDALPEREPLRDDARIAEALEAPAAGPSLAEVLEGARAVTVAVPDRTRAAGVGRLLPIVLAHVTAAVDAGVPVCVVSGGGTHAPDARIEALAALPRALAVRVSAGVHDARDAPAHASVGRTPRGTPVALDRRVVDGAPVVIVVGAIGFHYFAGFAGGRKGIFPGLGAYESVRRNHELVLAPGGSGLHPRCRPGVLEGNPVHEDMVDAAALLPGRTFLVNAICTAAGEVAEVVTGDVVAAHASGCRAYAAARACPIGEPVDLVLADAGGHPRDIDLVQAHKSLVHAAPALRAGGTLVLRAACGEGIGSRTLLPWFDAGDAASMERALRADYQLNAHTALSLRRLAERFDLVMVTSLPGDIIARIGARAASSTAGALADAASRRPRTGLVVSTPTNLLLEPTEVS